MSKKVQSDVVALMDEFVSRVRVEKTASEEGAQKRKAMDSQYKQSKEKDTDEKEGKVGAPGTEETNDMKKGLGDAKPAIEAETPKSADSGSTIGEVDSDESVDKAEIGHSETKAEEDPIAEKPEPLEKDAMSLEKKAYLRNARLANKIMETLNKEAMEAENNQEEPPVMQKLAALKEKHSQSKEQSPTMQKLAALKAEFELGVAQRRQDEAELVQAGMSKEAASQLLDKIALEDPMAVAPAEAVPDEELAIAEQAAAVEELLEAGVSPEEIMEAAGVTEEDVVDALAEAGIGPEELEAMAAAEAGAVAPAEAAPVAGDMAAGSPEEEAIAELLEAGVPPEEIEAALVG